MIAARQSAARSRRDPGRTPSRCRTRSRMREKDLGIWRESTWADVLGRRSRPSAHALLALGRRARRPGGHPLREPAGVARRRHGRTVAVRAASVGIYPTNPAAEVGYLLGDSGARVLVAEDQEQVDKAFAVLDECPDLERIVYLEPRGIRHRYDHPSCCSTGRTSSSWARRTASSTRAPSPSVARRPAGRRPRDPDLHLGHDRPAQGRDAHRRQRGVRDRGPDRGGRVHRPAARARAT